MYWDNIFPRDIIAFCAILVVVFVVVISGQRFEPLILVQDCQNCSPCSYCLSQHQDKINTNLEAFARVVGAAGTVECVVAIIEIYTVVNTFEVLVKLFDDFIERNFFEQLFSIFFLQSLCSLWFGSVITMIQSNILFKVLSLLKGFC